jgi:hypothetical protein
MHVSMRLSTADAQAVIHRRADPRAKSIKSMNYISHLKHQAQIEFNQFTANRSAW